MARRKSDGHLLNEQSSLFGILNFIWDAMDVYGDDPEEDVQPTLKRWFAKYHARTWQPQGGNGGMDVYSVD
jgi:hypothetical protein